MRWPEDLLNQVICGDCLDIMAQIPDNTIHCCVTSPPYWGLRDYKIEPRIWGGDGNCKHEWNQEKGRILRGTDKGTRKEVFPEIHLPNTNSCKKCGAWLGSLGLEPTPEMYVQHLVEISREVKRVLREDGTFWLNLGDSYIGGGRGGKGQCGKGSMEEARYERGQKIGLPTGCIKGLKPKDLCGIPWRVALALQADGWWLRSDIIYAKPNPMPESVSGSRWERHRIKIKSAKIKFGQGQRYEDIGQRQGSNIASHGDPDRQPEWQDCPGCPKCSPNDGYVLRISAGRPTRSHEYVFLLTKNETYFFDQEAIRELYAESSHERYRYKVANHNVDINKRKQGWITTKNRTERKKLNMNPSGRNIRSVWTIMTKSFKGTHFATFPPELPERCIKAGTSEKGVCPRCGSPWVRIVERNAGFNEDDICRGCGQPKSKHIQSAKSKMVTGRGQYAPCSSNILIGWRPSCTCNAGEPTPVIVLDPFAGAGTTGMVAKQLGRDYVLIDIKPEYCEMARKRIGGAVYQMNLEGR